MDQVQCLQRGRYLVGEAIGEGGMATVHLGRLAGEAGFSRIVAIKCLRSDLASNADLRNQLVDEARLVSRVRHGNVVQTLDVIAEGEERLLVLDYVPGASLAHLRRLAVANGELVPPRIASAIIFGTLRGLHAAHEASDEEGRSLDIVHRDVSPQNMLVGIDGEARVLDFGIAKAVSRLHETTSNGDLRGKLAYMAPEQLAAEPIDRRCDLFSAAVVLWESLTGKRLFASEEPSATMNAVLNGAVPRLEGRFAGATAALDSVLARALAKDPADRFSSADQMARALESVLPPASPRVVSAWVHRVAKDVLADREQRVTAFERAAARAEANATARARARALDDADLTAELSRTFCPRGSSPPPARHRTPVATIPEDEWAALAASAQSASLAPPADPCLPRQPVTRYATPLAMSVSTGDVLAWRVDSDTREAGSVATLPPLAVAPFPPMSTRRRQTMLTLAMLLLVLPLVAMATVVSGRPGPHARAAAAGAAQTPSLPDAASASASASASAQPAVTAPIVAAPPIASAAVPISGCALVPSAKPAHAHGMRGRAAPVPVPVRLPMRVD